MNGICRWRRSAYREYGELKPCYHASCGLVYPVLNYTYKQVEKVCPHCNRPIEIEKIDGNE